MNSLESLFDSWPQRITYFSLLYSSDDRKTPRHRDVFIQDLMKMSDAGRLFSADHYSRARDLFHLYHRQLTRGCGVAECTSLICASNLASVRPSEQRAGQRAIEVIKQSLSHRLCPMLTIPLSSSISHTFSSNGISTCEFRVVDQLHHLHWSTEPATVQLTAMMMGLRQHDIQQRGLGTITPRQLDMLLMSLAIHHYFKRRCPIAVLSLAIPQIERLLRLMHCHHHPIAKPCAEHKSQDLLNHLDWKEASARWTADGDVTASRLQTIAKVIQDKLRTYLEHGHIIPSTVTVPMAAAVLLFAFLLHSWATREESRGEVANLLSGSLANDLTAVISSVTPVTFPKLGVIHSPAAASLSEPRPSNACVDDEVRKRVELVKRSYREGEKTCDGLVDWIGQIDFTGKSKFIEEQIASLVHGHIGERCMGCQIHGVHPPWSAHARWTQMDLQRGEVEHDPFAGRMAVTGLRLCVAATPPLDSSALQMLVKEIEDWATADADDPNWYWGHSRDQRERVLLIRSKNRTFQPLYPSYIFQRSRGHLVLADELLRFVGEHKEAASICSSLLSKLFDPVFRDLRETVQQQKVIAESGHEWLAAEKWIPPYEDFPWYRTSITRDIDIYLVLSEIITRYVPSSDLSTLSSQLLKTLGDYVAILETFYQRLQRDSRYHSAYTELELRLNPVIRQLLGGLVRLGADSLCDRVLTLLQQSRHNSQQPSFLQRAKFKAIVVQLDLQSASELFTVVKDGELVGALVSICPSRAEYNRLTARVQTSSALKSNMVPVNPLHPVAVTKQEKVAMAYSWFVEFWSVNLRRLFGRWVAGQPQFFVDRQLLYRELGSYVQDGAHHQTAQDWMSTALVFADDGDQDWLTALHVMLPAVEWILQVTVQSRRVQVPRTRCRSMEMNLTALGRDTEDPFEKFFFDVHLRLLLTNRHACNLRNTPAHGLLSLVGNVSIDSDRLSFFAVLHSFLVCVVYSGKKLSSSLQPSKAMQSAEENVERLFASLESAQL